MAILGLQLVATNGCGTCASHSYEFVDNGPFEEGVKYYYRIRAEGNNGTVQVSGNCDGSPILFPVPLSKDWKKQTTDNIVIGSTSPNRNNYSWHEETNITQGVRLNLIPAEKVPIYLQQSNAIINFELNDLNYMVDLQINING